MLALAEVPGPEPGPGQVLVRVLGAATNFPDVLMRRGGGETLLVHAAAGGVGSGAVQLGKAAGARVIGVAGGTLSSQDYLSPRVVAGIGALAGQVSRALRSFTHRGLDRVLQWDLAHADRVVERLAGHMADASLRARVTDAASAAWRQVQAVAAQLPRQAVHGPSRPRLNLPSWMRALNSRCRVRVPGCPRVAGSG